MSSPPVVTQKLNAPPGSSAAAVTYGVSDPPEEKASSMTLPAGNALSSSDVPMWRQEKQGAKCCGCCCDYRRAVIMIAVTTLFFSFFTVLGVILEWSFTGVSSPNIDNEIKEGLEKIEEGDKNVRMALFIVSTVTSIASLIGALKFNASLVACNVAGCLGKSFVTVYPAESVPWVLDLSLICFVIVTFVGGIILTVGNKDEVTALMKEEGIDNYS